MIVTADDFGAAKEVNDAVEAAHTDGVLTAASLMVGAPAAHDAVSRARRLPGLAVGLHLVLTEGRPVSPRESVPDLVDHDEYFRTDMTAMGVDIFLRPRVRRQIAREIAAQFDAFKATGLLLDHVNAHKHFHLHPTIAGMVLAIGARFGMRALRVPSEPARLLREIDSRTPAPAFWSIDPWTHLLRVRARRHGLFSADQTFGTAWSGELTEARLCSLVARLPEGVTEIYAHPATSAGFPGSAPSYRYADELSALTSSAVRGAVRASGARCTGFRVLAST